MRRFGASVLIAAAVVAGLTPVETATAVQANCQTDIPVIGDVDGDGRSDLIVGVPGRSSNTGEVDLRHYCTEQDLVAARCRSGPRRPGR